MPRRCSVCGHPDLGEIDRALVAGQPFRHIAARYGTSTGALQRHRAEHLPETLSVAAEAGEVARADDLLGQVRDLQRRAVEILDQAQEAGELDTALRAIGQARGCLELLGKLAGELQSGTTINLVIAPEWVELRGVIVAALQPFAEARSAVVRALGARNA